MNKTLILCIVIATLLISSLISACAAPTPAPSPAPTPAPTPSPAPTPTPTPTPAPTPAPSQPAEVFNWRLQSFGTPNDIPHEMKLQMADDLQKMTDGRLNITVYTAGQLVAASDVLEAVAQGTIEAGDTVGAYFTGAIPEAQIEFGIPATLQTDWQVASLFWERGWLDLVREAYGEKGVYYLAPRANGNFGLWATKPVRTIDDIQGLKVRALGAVADMMKIIGASPVSVPLGEAYLALQTGTIDAMSTGQYVYGTLSHYEVAEYFMVPGIAPSLVGHFLINPEAWNALPQDIQAQLNAYMIGHFYEYGRREKQENFFVQAKIESEWGNTIVTMSPELQDTMKEASLEVLDSYAQATPRSAEMANILKEYMDLLGY